MTRLLLTAMIALLTSVGAAWAGPFEDGAAAEGRGGYIEAMKQYRQAAEHGDAKAEHHIGTIYAKGLGVQQNEAEADKWFLRSAEHGNAECQFLIGFRYRDGWGGPPNYPESLKWLRKAAGQGHTAAMGALAIAYRNGEGVPEDIVRAHMWYNLQNSLSTKAYEQNIAKQMRDRMAAQMTPQQIEEAQKLARECQQRKFKDCD
jgi:TPR repeat protein